MLAVEHCERRRSIRPAVLGGALAWIVAPAISPFDVGSLDHGFLFFPLVAAPLGLALAMSVVGPSGAAARIYAAARRAQPIAAAGVLLAFLLPRGALSGVLVVPWIAMALALAWAGIAAATRNPYPHLSRVNVIGAHLLLPAGSVWLSMSRLGIGPAGMTGTLVMLAALHFHFTGFLLQIFVAAMARHVPRSARDLASLQRAVGLAAIAGVPLIAAGGISNVATVKSVGVLCIVLGAIGLAIVAVPVALGARDVIGRRLLLCSSASVGAGMILAAGYRAAEVLGTPWIGIDAMVPTHGLLNAVGFVVCGAIAHLRLFTAATR
jgi:hypothetical protein